MKPAGDEVKEIIIEGLPEIGSEKSKLTIAISRDDVAIGLKLNTRDVSSCGLIRRENHNLVLLISPPTHTPSDHKAKAKFNYYYLFYDIGFFEESIFTTMPKS